MKKLIFLLLVSCTGFAQLSPAISNVYFDTTPTNNSNRGELLWLIGTKLDANSTIDGGTIA